MRRWWMIMLIMVGCVGQGAPATLSPRLQQLQQRGSLIVGTAITQPFEYYDSSGTLVGFDVDLMTLIAARLNVRIEWREMAFADLLPALSSGDLDVVIAAMYIRADREAVIDFTQPYLDTGLVMLVHADDDAIQTFEDLAGRTVGVKEGATGAAYAQRLLDEQGVDLQIRIYTDTIDSLEDLSAGRIDAVFNDRLNSLVYIRDHPDVRIQGEVFDPAALGIAVRTGDAELLAFLNDSLDALRAAGEIDRLFRQWISPEGQS